MESRNSYIISKGFRHYFGATILYAVVEQLCTMLDMVFAGNFVSSEAFAAMDLVLPFETLATGIMLMLTGGAGTVASRHIGNQDFDRANKVLSFAIISSAAVSIAMSVLSLLFMDSLVGLICGDAALAVHVHDYLKVFVLGFIPMSLYFILTEIIDIDGEPELATKAVVVGCAVDIVLDVVLMKFFGMGVGAVALSSIFAYIVPTLMYVPYLRSDKCRFYMSYTIGEKMKTLKENLTYGVPYAMPYIVTFLMCWFVNSLVLNRYGADGVYVWGVGFQILSLGFMIMDSVGRTVLVTMGSMLYGCSDYHGLSYLVRRCLSVSLISMLSIVAFVFIFPEQVCALFGESSEESLEASKWAVRYISLFLIPYAICCIKAYLSQVLERRKGSAVLFFSLILLTIGGLAAAAYSDGRDIYVSIPLTGLVFLFADFCISAAVRMMNPNLSRYFLIPHRTDSHSLFLSIPYTEAGMNDALHRLEEYMDGCTVSMRLRTAINICCEEMILDLVRFNEEKGKSEGYYFDLFVLEEKDSVKVKVQDAGRPFNPVRKFDKSPNPDSDELDISLQLLNGLCNELEYNYLYGQNTVYMNFVKK